MKSLSSRKILHAADIHLDSPLKKLDRYESAPADRIRRASRQALENMTDLAINQEVDLVVIAGDLYDGDWTDQNTGLAFVAQAAKLVNAGIPLLVIRGNHDAANLMTSQLPLPQNPDGSEIFLQTGNPESRIFESTGIAVHGQSFRSRAEKKNLAAKYPVPVAGLFNLGLLHTGLEGASSHAHYAPCTPQELTDKGYDYWALGHIHTRFDHGIEGGAPIVFSGNVQGRHIGEQGAKGCVIVEIDERNQCQHVFHELDVLRWLECAIDVGSVEDQDEICDRYRQWLSEMIHECGSRLVIARVSLVGESDLHHRLHRFEDQLEADLQAVTVATAGEQGWLESVKIRTRLPQNNDFDASLEGPLESINSVLQSLRQDPELGLILEKELTGLHKKLPRELRSEEESVFRFDDPLWADALVETAAAEVLGGILQIGDSDEKTGGRS